MHFRQEKKEKSNLNADERALLRAWMCLVTIYNIESLFHVNNKHLMPACRTLIFKHGAELGQLCTVWVHRISSKYNTYQNVPASECSDSFLIEKTVQSRSVTKAPPKKKLLSLCGSCSITPSKYSIQHPKLAWEDIFHIFGFLIFPVQDDPLNMFHEILLWANRLKTTGAVLQRQKQFPSIDTHLFVCNSEATRSWSPPGV